MAVRALERLYERVQQHYREARETRRVEDDQAQAAARQLLDEIRRTGVLPAGPASSLNLRYEETHVRTIPAAIWRKDSSPDGIGTWNSYGPVTVTLTNQRMVIKIQGTWHTYRHGDLLELSPDSVRRSVTLGYNELPPIRLQGAWVPWLVVGLGAATFGPGWLGSGNLDEVVRPHPLQVDARRVDGRPPPEIGGRPQR